MTEETNQATKLTPQPEKPVQFQGEQVTYLPAEGDPAHTKWRGYEFKANVPVLVKDKELVEKAKTNQFFKVGNTPPSTQSQMTKPATVDQYKAWVIAWLKQCMTVDDLARHWAVDQSLRIACEVGGPGSPHLRYLGTLIEPKLRAMSMAEGLNDSQMAEVFVRHGILELPWRS